jgi:hypothetical protein
MDKLYRMVHADGFCFKAFGVSFGVRTSQPSASGRIKAQLPPGSKLMETGKVESLYSFLIQGNPSRAGTRLLHLLYLNSQVLARAENESGLMDIFESDLNFRIATNSSTRFFVHAGVIAWRGQAIVIPGRSCTGKSSLVREFLRQGATYYSDEFAVFDSRGYVHPFATSLGVRDNRNQRQSKIPVEKLGCPVGTKPLRPRFVLLTHYDKSACWRPRRISRVKAALSFLQNSFCTRQRPETALRYAGEAVRSAIVLRGVRGEAAEVVSTFLSGSPLLNQDFAAHRTQGEKDGHERSGEV